MPEADDDLLPVSALQHFVFCPRRAGLVHIEGLWSENRFTAEGRVVHDRVHDANQSEKRSTVRAVRGLEIRSQKYRLTGKADLVEFHSSPKRIIPVEYKRGEVKLLSPEFRVQLCAQAFCLEEMLNEQVPEGAIYYAKSRKRLRIEFDDALRQETLEAIAGLHQLIDSRVTPLAFYDRRCRRCSLVDLCLPRTHKSAVAASRYLQLAIAGRAGIVEDISQ